MLADNSQSLALRDRGSAQTRGEQVQALLAEKTPWSARLGQDFDVRRYAFDTQLRAVPDFATLAFDGEASALGDALARLARRYRDRPLAGILLFTDGNATDLEALERLIDAAGGEATDSSSCRRSIRCCSATASRPAT